MDGTPSPTRRDVLQVLGASAAGAGVGATAVDPAAAQVEDMLPSDDDLVDAFETRDTFDIDHFSVPDSTLEVTMQVEFYGTVPSGAAAPEDKFEAQFMVSAHAELLDYEDEPGYDLTGHELTVSEGGRGSVTFPYSAREGFTLHTAPNESDGLEAFNEAAASVVGGALGLRQGRNVVGAALGAADGLGFVLGEFGEDDDDVDAVDENSLHYDSGFVSADWTPWTNATMYVMPRIDLEGTPAEVTFHYRVHTAPDSHRDLEKTIYVNEVDAAEDPDDLEDSFTATVRGPSAPEVGSTATYTVEYPGGYDPEISWRKNYEHGDPLPAGSGDSITVTPEDTQPFNLLATLEPQYEDPYTAGRGVSPVESPGGGGDDPHVVISNVDAPDATYGAEYTFGFDYENVGDTGEVETRVDAHDGATGEHILEVARGSGELEAGESGSVEYTVRDLDLVDEVDLVVSITPGDHREIDVTFEPPTEPDVRVESVTAQDSTYGEPLPVEVEWLNRGARTVTDLTVTVEKDLVGDHLASATTTVAADYAGRGTETFEFEVGTDWSQVVSVEADVEDGGSSSDRAAVETPPEPLVVVEDVTAPAEGTVGEAYELEVAYDNLGEEGEAVLAVGSPVLDSHLDAVTLDVLWAEEDTVTLSFEVPEELAGEAVLTVEVLEGESTEYVDVTFVDGPDPSEPEVSFVGMDTPDGVVGEPYTLTIEYENDGDAGEREVLVGAVDPATDEELARLATEVKHFAAGSGEVELEFVPPKEAAGDVRLDAAIDAGAYTYIQRSVTFEGGPDCREFQAGEICDVNGDGLYRDVTGNGEVGQTDVVEFFNNQHREAWKRPEYFDYTEDGSVTHSDVIALFEYASLN